MPDRAMTGCSRALLAALAVLAVLAAGGPAAGAAPADDPALAVHRAALVLDAHCDLPPGFATPANDPGVEGASQIDLPKLDRGAVDAVVLSVFAWQRSRTVQEDGVAVATGREKLEAIRRAAEQYPARLAIARTADELEQVVASGRHAAVISVLNATVLGPEAGLLDEYYAAGLRQLGFVHAGHNAYADSSRPRSPNGDGPTLWGGLSPLGRTLLTRLNDLGVIVDVSQLSSAALREVVSLSRAPVVASHSAVRARVDAPRNLDDDEIRAIAATGGVVHVVAFSSYLRAPPASHEREVAALRARFGAADEAAVAKLPPERAAAYEREYIGLLRTLPRAGVGDLVDAIDHVVKLVGVAHVGIATDFEHSGGVAGFEDASRAPNVTRELLRRGYSAGEIAMIWGGNWLRVFREVERRRRP